MHLRIVVVMGLLYKLVFNEFADNFCSTELDVSLLTKMTKTLSWVLIVLNDASIADDVKDVLGNAIFEVHKLFDEIKTESLRCKVDALFRRVINYKLQTLIETLEGLSLGELVSELGVFNTDWNQTPDSFYPLSTYLSALLDKIVSSDFIGKFQATKLDLSLLEKLKTILVRVLHTDYVKLIPLDLHDAVDKHTFRLWLCMLKDAIFELLNLFDEINREALHFKVEAAYETPTPPSPGLNTLYWAINSKLKNLIARLEFCSLRVHGQFGGSSFKIVWHETPSSSILDDESSSIYGRDNEFKELKHLLLSEDGDDSKIGIISIVGMEGIGKTALAKLLYNDTKVRDKFKLQVWAHVSKDFDDLNVFETILNEVNNIYPKCLIVLDEVCDARSIRTLLVNMSNLGETGSRIIITTQDERVALSIQTFGLSMQTFLSVHYLRPLESEDCWTLLAGHAFGDCNDQQRSNLEEIGRGIANKCYGSPFAAVALGDILCTKLSLDYWNYVLENDILLLLDHDVRPFIQLSYHYLPTPLKRCFEYCSIFPKKSMIEKNLIVQLWIAEGLVESSTDQEKVGEEYFDVLVSRSLLHRRSIGNGEVNIEMHNLVHDLATKVSSPNCINMDEHSLHDRVRTLSYNRGIYDSV